MKAKNRTAVLRRREEDPGKETVWIIRNTGNNAMRCYYGTHAQALAFADELRKENGNIHIVA